MALLVEEGRKAGILFAARFDHRGDGLCHGYDPVRDTSDYERAHVPVRSVQ